MEPVEITADTWPRIVDVVRKRTNNADIPIWSCFVTYYNVCVPSLVTTLSHKLWHLYRRIDGTSNETYASYLNLPAFWVDACDVIDTEIARIDKLRADKAQRQQREIMRNLKRGK